MRRDGTLARSQTVCHRLVEHAVGIGKTHRSACHQADENGNFQVGEFACLAHVIPSEPGISMCGYPPRILSEGFA